MGAWRILASLVILLAAASLGQAQTYSLAEPIKKDDCFRIHLEMSLTGEMQVYKEGKPVPLKLTATATHQFPERILSLGSAGLPDKSARSYETARAIVTVQDDRTERTLAPEHRFMVAQRTKDQLLLYSPAGQLSREELELTSEHFDTLTLTGLLPGRAVAVGDTWKVANSVAQALCCFEGLTEQDLTCKLEEVKDKVARVSVKGIANGIDVGAQVKLTIQATYHFDLTSSRLTWLEWKTNDKRDQGPVNPATSVESTTTLKRTAEDAQSIANVALFKIPEDEQTLAPLLQLMYRDPKSRFELLYNRDWHVVGQTEDHLVMRLMDRGDFVAQVTVTNWKKAEKGKHATPEECREALANIPGWEQEKELQAGEIKGDEGRWTYRISALGRLEGTAVVQNYYLVAGPDGDQLVLLFLMTPRQAERLGSRDLSLVGSLDFPAGK